MNLKDKTILVLDNGYFFEFALKLTDFYGKVYYHVNWIDAFPGITLAKIGTEWRNGKQLNSFDSKNFQRIEEPFTILDEIDVVFATDSYYGDLIEFLREYGIPCFGPGKAEKLELDRKYFLENLKKYKMDCPTYTTIIGLDNLREYLKDEKNIDKYIKISKYRQMFETFHHTTYKTTEPILDKLNSYLGPMKSIVEFIITDPIKAIIEQGVDVYAVNGIFPTNMIQGIEIKDTAYTCLVGNKLSEGNRKVNFGYSQMLKDHNFSGFTSTEVRTTKEGKNYFIDPCIRNGNPPNCIVQIMYTNLGEIIWEGANGRLIEPIFQHKYGLELILTTDWVTGAHETIYFPKKYRDNIKLVNCIKVDGIYSILKPESDSLSIGSVVVTCNDLEKGRKQIEEIVKSIESFGLNYNLTGLDRAIEDFKIMENGL